MRIVAFFVRVFISLLAVFAAWRPMMAVPGDNPVKKAGSSA